MAKIVNVTPHAISVLGQDGNTRVFPPSGTPARVSSRSVAMTAIDGMAVVKTVFGEVENLPVPEEGTFFVVSGLVLDTSRRPDLLAPGELIRDPEGKPLGCKGFRCA